MFLLWRGKPSGIDELQECNVFEMWEGVCG
jgi:hypothetical protein